MITDTALWSRDVDWRHAGALYNTVLPTIPDAVLMVLLTHTHIEPMLASANPALLQEWHMHEHGWLFGDDGELRWRRLHDGTLRFVYLGRSTTIPDNATDGSQLLNGLEPVQGQVVAWKISPDGALRQLASRAQHDQTKAGSTELAFRTVSYVTPTTGHIVFWRHTGIQPADTSQPA